MKQGKTSGRVTFNGEKLPKKFYHRDVAYITQEDIHMAALTVKETLEFSAKLQLPSTIPRRVADDRANIVMQLTGLTHRADTIVGNALMRGVSGGEKKRVTVGIECTKAAGVMLLDEPTTGLDSQAALDLMRVLRTVADSGPPIMVSLLQPSMEMFNLFDNLMIMSGGEVAWFGPRKEALDYFYQLGHYKCHPNLNPAEFLQEIVESSTVRNQSCKKFRDIDEGSEAEGSVAHEHWHTREEFIEAYKESPYYEKVMQTVEEFQEMEDDSLLGAQDEDEVEQDNIADSSDEDEEQARVKQKQKEKEQKRDLSKSQRRRRRRKLMTSAQKRMDYSREKEYPTSIIYQFKLLLNRAVTQEKRVPQTIVSRLFGTILLAMVVGTTFIGTSNSQRDARTKMGLLFYVCNYFVFGGLASIPALLAERKLYNLQRTNKYYTSLPYLIANVMIDIPLAVIEVLIFGTIVYWMSGLNNAEYGAHYYIFLPLLFSNYMVFKALGKMIAAFSPTVNVAMGFAPVLLVVFIVLSGFIVPRTSIPYWWLWLHYLSPLSYTYEAVAINEFRDQTFYCGSGEKQPPSSISNFAEPFPAGYNSRQVCPITDGTKYIDRQFDLQTEGYFIAINFVVVWAFFLIINFLTWIGLQYVHFSPTRRATASEEIEQGEENEQRNAMAIRSHKKSRKLTMLLGRHKSKDRGMRKNSSKEVEMQRSDSNVGGGPGESDGGSVSDLSKHMTKGAYLSFDDLCYTVSSEGTSLQLLHNICGYSKPGMMLALMGSSGAGKTTLLDVLAQRKTGGKITGDILIDGKKMSGKSKRLIGYVEQTDIHLPTQTVLEALEFSAMTRLPSNMARKKKKKIARDVMELLGLSALENVMIGTNSDDGLSADQRKRLTIGVELAADPAILFLDEPTSGLDSMGAERVMYAVKRAAASGKSVICTIHQPSASLFGLFTHLCLLKKGGYQTYFGPIGDGSDADFSVLLGYFEELGFKCPPHKNPADFILEASGAGIAAGRTDKPIDFASRFSNSNQFGKLKDTLRERRELSERMHKSTKSRPESGAPGDSQLEGVAPEKKKGLLARYRESRRYAAPYYMQFYYLMKRGLLSYWRDPEGMRTRVVRALFLGVFFGTLFLQVEDDQRGAANRVSLLYFMLNYAVLNALPTVTKVIEDRAVFYRERASSTYASWVYAFHLMGAELPYSLVTSVLFVIPLYFIAGLQYEASKFFIFYGIFILFNLTSLSITQMVAVVSPNIVAANALISVVLSLCGLFAGFLITRTSIPPYWIWAYYINPFTYALEAVVVNEMTGLDLHCSRSEQVPVNTGNGTKPYCPITSGSAFLSQFDMVENIGRDVGIEAGILVIMFILILLGLKFINHQRR
eukprot:TRINITY_DN2282_c0_g1_i1.p1 TRINITY_DN2282_c0_g1~~TRINITY_DN2282_c0_g1_i1.p1  ORF type:complete len:1497 (-),score=261.71 TRINITY_DN2282_c0_g1_i1:27-4118(-)